jgi:hypothetical protein
MISVVIFCVGVAYYDVGDFDINSYVLLTQSNLMRIIFSPKDRNF